jgi:hypothetical protein
MESADLKRRLGQAASRGKRGYPAELREAALAYAARRTAEGISRRAAASELGLSEQTLWYWRKRESKRAALVPVTIEPARASGLVVEFGPVRVRGLDVAGVAELLRRLG